MVDEIYMFLSQTIEGTEEIAAFQDDAGVWMPMVIEKERFEKLRPMATKMVNESKIPMSIVRFVRTEAVEVIEPDTIKN